MRVRGGSLRRRPHRPGAGILLLAIALLVGAATGLVVEAVVWQTEASGRGVVDAWDHALENAGVPTVRAAAFMAAGATAFFLGTGLYRGTFRNVASTVGTMLTLLLGATVGAILGALAFLGLWAARMQTEAGSFAEVTVDAFVAEPIAAAFFVMFGATIGIAVTAYAGHDRPIERIGATFAGLLLGAFAGLFLFAVSSLVVDPPPFPVDEDWFYAVGEATTSGTALEFVFLGYGALLGFFVARYEWRFHGFVTFASLIAVIGGFILYSLAETLPNVPAESRWFAWTLFWVETASLGMVLLYSFYTIDVTSRTQWRRRAALRQHSVYYLPKVAFQVPCFNEPPDVVIETIRRLEDVDYPRDRFLVMVLDDSTKDECRQPLEAYCTEQGLTYIHRDDRTGYKAGALNGGLEKLPDDVELIAVIDADYQIQRDYLAETVGYFSDINLGWLQTPQAYRNKEQSYLTQQYHLADAYFYRTVMPSRNEEDTIIFAGTMGVVRRDALEEVGGWGEKYITEDAELSLRLLLKGYTSMYVNKTYGRGLIPATFDGYKKQQYRWAFGGAKILRGHAFHLLFGRLTRRQAFDYFVGSVHWFEGLFILAVAGLLSTLAIAQLVGWDLVTHHSQEILLVGLIPLFVLTDGLTRLHTVMHHALKLSPVQTLRILGMWFSVKFSNAAAATKAFLGFNIPFVRTPKAPTERIGRKEAFARAVRVSRFETLVASFLLLLILALTVQVSVWTMVNADVPASPVFLIVWLLYYFAIFSAAPLYAYRSYVTFRPFDEGGSTLQRPQAAHAGPA